jgi:type II secretory pathway component GspD/PulD (secretin)
VIAFTSLSLLFFPEEAMTVIQVVRGWRSGLSLCLLLIPAVASAQEFKNPPSLPPLTPLPTVKKEPPVTDLVPLTALDGDKVAETLRAMLGDHRSGGPFIEAVALRNALLVRGSAEQIQEIKTVLRVLGEAGEKQGGMRILTLDRGSAATMADAIQGMLTQMRANPVKVIVPGKQGEAAPPKPDDKKPQADKSPPVALTAFGNRLIVTSEDPQALALAVELFRLLLAPATEGDFEVIRLKNAQAASVARVLDEAFNGPGRPARGAMPGGPPPERVRVVADPATNSLLIKASPLDTLTIRKLLTAALDIPEAKRGNEPPREGRPGT